MQLKQQKKKSISFLKRKADRVFSLWIRQRDRFCFTCNSTQNIQAGHFISRSYLFYRYDEKNVHGQCLRCNIFLRGNMRIYTYNMLETYGGELVKKMEQQKFRKILNPRKYYEYIIKEYGNRSTN